MATEITSDQQLPPAEVEEVILLIHGIRDYATWQHMVSEEVKSAKNRVVGVKYGYFNVFRFLAPRWPVDFTRSPRARVLRELRSVKDEYPNAKVSVVAHSFGSYLISRLLSEEPDIRFHRILLCGSVVEQDFRWDTVKERIGPHGCETAKYLVNDCGTNDIWPVLGRTFGWNYGDAGTNGFGSTLVSDRCHKGGHSLFARNLTFVRTYWAPFFREGRIIPGEGTFREDVPTWLTLIPLVRWLLLVVLLVLASVPVWHLVSSLVASFRLAKIAGVIVTDRQIIADRPLDDWTLFTSLVVKAQKPVLQIKVGTGFVMSDNLEPLKAKLEELTVEQGTLASVALNSLQTFRELRFLRLSGCILKGSLTSMPPRLIDLYMDNTKSIEEVSTQNDRSLKHVYLRGSQVQRVRLKKMDSLIELDLTGCSDLVLLDLAEVDSLRKLLISDTKLSQPMLPKLSNLTTFGFDGNRSASALHLSGMESLHNLSVVNNENLEKVTIEGCETLIIGVRNDDIVFSANPILDTVEFRNCSSIPEIATHFEKTTELRRTTYEPARRLLVLKRPPSD